MKKQLRVLLVLSLFAFALSVKAYDTGPPKTEVNDLKDVVNYIKSELSDAGQHAVIFTVTANYEVEPLLSYVALESSFAVKNDLDKKNLKFPEVRVLRSDATIPIPAQASYIVSYKNKHYKLPDAIRLHNFAIDRYWC